MISAEQLNILIEVAPFAGAWIEIRMSLSRKPITWSLPSRERGLKCPFSYSSLIRSESLPSRERGLKSFTLISRLHYRFVAPFAGAWIEIPSTHPEIAVDLVAPFAGAWIEIAVRTHYTVKVYASLPSRERGLKFYMEKK